MTTTSSDAEKTLFEKCKKLNLLQYHKFCYHQLSLAILETFNNFYIKLHLHDTHNSQNTFFTTNIKHLLIIRNFMIAIGKTSHTMTLLTKLANESFFRTDINRSLGRKAFYSDRYVKNCYKNFRQIVSFWTLLSFLLNLWCSEFNFFTADCDRYFNVASLNCRINIIFGLFSNFHWIPKLS